MNNTNQSSAIQQSENLITIIGAGAAGIGMGVALSDLGLTDYLIVDRHEVGASFLRWPQQMRFISPSFTSNAFGLLDLNAVTYTTSPAYSLQSEHPTGAEYARYLQGVADLYQLPIQTGVDVHKIQPVDGDHQPCAPDRNQGFLLETSQGSIYSHFVIWAAGEFQYPNLEIFPGSEHCLHNATVQDWANVPGDEFVIIGGYESGIDAAVNLINLGKRVKVLDDTAPWDLSSPDPSLVLSTYTMQRLVTAQATGRLELLTAGVESVQTVEGSGYEITLLDEDGTLQAHTRPILATGFIGSLDRIANLLTWHPQSYHALLTAEDESIRTQIKMARYEYRNYRLAQ